MPDGKPQEVVWINDKPGPVEPSLLYYRGLLSVLMDNGVLRCLDGRTGKEHYRHRLGGDCNSSPIASDGHICLSNNDGTTFVVKTGPEFKLLATNELGERITASPAMVANKQNHLSDRFAFALYRCRRQVKLWLNWETGTRHTPVSVEPCVLCNAIRLLSGSEERRPIPVIAPTNWKDDLTAGLFHGLQFEIVGQFCDRCGCLTLGTCA